MLLALGRRWPSGLLEAALPEEVRVSAALRRAVADNDEKACKDILLPCRAGWVGGGGAGRLGRKVPER